MRSEAMKRERDERDAPMVPLFFIASIFLLLILLPHLRPLHSQRCRDRLYAASSRGWKTLHKAGEDDMSIFGFFAGASPSVGSLIGRGEAMEWRDSDDPWRTGASGSLGSLGGSLAKLGYYSRC